MKMEYSTEKRYYASDWLGQLLLGLALMSVFIILFTLWQNHCSNILAENSNSDHGGTIEEVAMSLINEDCEVMVLFDMSGKKLFEWTSDEKNRVSTSERWISLAKTCSPGGVVAMHNHPQLNAAFSCGDLLMAAQSQCKTQIVVTPFSMFILEAPNGWPKAAQIRSFLQRVIYGDFETALASGYVFTSDHDDVEEFYTTSTFIEFYAEEFDLEFSVQKLNRHYD